MDKKSSLLMIIPVLAITVLLGVSAFLLPDEEYDEVENRNLAVISQDDILKTGFAQKFDDYFTDQFPFRQIMVKAYTGLLIAEGKVYVRDLVINNGWLLSKDYKPNDSEMKKAADAINSLAGEGFEKRPVYFLCAPTKTHMLDYMLPFEGLSFRQSADEFAKKLSGDIVFVNALDAMYTLEKERKESMYFKADYHWNGRGAFFAFSLLMEEMEGRGDLPEGSFIRENYAERTVSGKLYKGDLNRRMSYRFPQDETIVYEDFKLELPVEIELLQNGELVKISQSELFASDIQKEALDYNGAYTLNWPYYKITSKNSASDKKALVIKDSMQNPTTLNFASVFRQIEVVDVRFLEGITAREILNESDADVIIVFYNSANLTGEMYKFDG